MPKKTTRLRLHVREELWGVYATPSPRKSPPNTAMALYPRQQETWNKIRGSGLKRDKAPAMCEGETIVGGDKEELILRILACVRDSKVRLVTSPEGTYLEITRKVQEGE